VNPLEFVVKLLWTAWPFVKEMVLEGRSLKDVFQVNRRRAIFALIIMASFLFNILNFGADARMISIMSKYVKLQKQYQSVLTDNTHLKGLMVDNGCPMPAAAATAVSAPAPVTPVAPVVSDANSNDEYSRLQDTFTNLNRR
jgi:hypothetical protein